MPRLHWAPLVSLSLAGQERGRANSFSGAGEAHVMAAERLHADDTTVPVLAKGKTDTGRCWVYVRDDKPFGGAGPPAAMFYYSRDRRGEHPQTHLARYAGILQADAYDGYNRSIWLDAILDRSGKRRVGSMRGARSSLWPTSKRMRDTRLPAKRKSHSLTAPVNVNSPRMGFFTVVALAPDAV